MLKSKNILSAGVLLLGLTAMSSTVWAQGGLGFQVGGADSGPMVANPSAIFWNPGALGAIRDPAMLIDIETVAGQGTYQRAPDANANFYPEVEAAVIFPIPFVGAVSDFGLEKWAFGAGVYLPFGSGGGWDKDGPQRYHLIRGAEGSLFFTAAAAYRITPKFSAGLGLSYVFSALQGELSFDLATTVQGLLGNSGVPAESPLFEAQIATDLLTNHNYAINGGFFWQPKSNIDIGLSFLLPSRIRYTGKIEVTLPASAGVGDPALALLGFDGSTVTADGQITILRPGIVMLGTSWRQSDRVTLEGSMIYALSSFNDEFKAELTGTGIPYLDAPEGTSIRDTGANDSYQLRGGAKYQLDPKFGISGYLSFIDPGIPSTHVTASSIGFNVLIPTFQLRYQANPQDLVSFSLSPAFAFSRNVTDSVYNPNLPASSGVGITTGNGDYSGFGLQVGLSYTRKF